MPERAITGTGSGWPAARWLAAGAGAVSALLCVHLVYAHAGAGYGAAMAMVAVLAAVPVLLWTFARRGWTGSPAAAALAAGAIALYFTAADPALTPWQVPSGWRDLFRLGRVGAALVCTLYLATAAWLIVRRGRPPAPGTTLVLLGLPLLFNLLLSLASPDFLTTLAAPLGELVHARPRLLHMLGNGLILAVFNIALIQLLALSLDRRGSATPRLHGLLLAAALAAAGTPWLADLGCARGVGEWPALLRILASSGSSALAQAGLWAETFLITGLLLDALRGHRPGWNGALAHWRSGLVKGLVYGGLFMLLVQLLATALAMPRLMALLQTQPVIGAALAGALLFPLARTVVESFDGSSPFLLRFAGSARQPLNYLRGAVAGAGLAFALLHALPQQADGLRFAAGFVLGALAYAGVDLLQDLLDIARGRRQRLQTWRLYALGSALGGTLGGALAWYLDAAQLAVVTEKFHAYAAIHYPTAGRVAADYVVYPLFSKWGALNLGLVEGGVRLLYDESLSGVINWSLAAPLFSINLTLLTALFRRSLAPLRELLSPAGFVTLVEQAVRVLRWGLWMAPVIYSFLRLAPDPSWYNQDGAVRSLVAIVQAALLEPGAFRDWSLQVFLGLLAYDWLRMLIWFDHMGLRVATLVNLSFVGGDWLDERAARWLGHSARTRCIPEGIRRFATWAPLLIPFYIPRGAEWDYVWSNWQTVQAAGPPLLPAVAGLMLGYRVAALAAAALLLWLLLQLRRRARAGSAGPPPPFALANDGHAFVCSADGAGYSQVQALDLNRRPDGPGGGRGKFFYLAETDAAGRLLGEPWSLAPEPCRRPDAATRVTPPAAGELRLHSLHAGIRCEARVRLDAREPAETWSLRLSNLEPRPRLLRLTSYQEPALAYGDAYRRTPAFAALHVATWFLRPLGAILWRNRLLHDADGLPSRQIAFHAAGEHADGSVRLTGYEDSRRHFIGRGTLRRPDALQPGRLRSPDDEGRLYGFDPAASLQLQITLPAGGSTELRFADGHARDERQAAALIARLLGIAMPADAALQSSLSRSRCLHECSEADPAGPDWQFSADGRELRLSHVGPRPWAHLLANSLGQGAIAGSDGEIYSFAGNAQQNGLTPFRLDSVPAQQPAQTVYVHDLQRDELHAPGFAPLRRDDARHEMRFGLGYAQFCSETVTLGIELTAWVPPDQPLELRRLRLRNRSGAALRLRVTTGIEMALAELPDDSRGRLETQAPVQESALLFRNPANDFRQGWAFVATSLPCTARETRRARFFGSGGHARPQMACTGLPDPACADDGLRIAGLSGMLELPANGEARIVLALGQAGTPQQARELIRRHCSPAAADASLAATRDDWTRILSVLRIETNRPDFDRLVNDWLPYQLLTARLWGRCGPDQRSGAFGFRDQLQDVLPLAYLQPAWARQQILLHAAQQFREGDVLKWWHASPAGETGIGVRSAASDPQLWLPYVAGRYVNATGDHALLEEVVPFLEGPRLPQGVEGRILAPRRSRDHGTLYDHCRRAIDLTLARRGRRGLPLLGAGDWNDGFDRAGLRGRGESVWLGFFLHAVLGDFSALAKQRGDHERAERYRSEMARLRAALNDQWRDDRYLRYISDDGEEAAPASAMMAAWPLLSGAVGLERGLAALEGALRHLEKTDRVLLGHPPAAEDSRPYPGRVADYPPGVRENGGQYSHGVSWLVDAYLRAAELAGSAGDAGQAARCQARAFELWLKISPLSKYAPGQSRLYGLAPHQQPADVYDGPGYAGRGGWSWYTGAAARMLSAAYALLGLRLVNGELLLPADPFAARGGLQLRRLQYRGQIFEPPPA